jgi:cbb3-type cytochrome c oxidase subunit III
LKACRHLEILILGISLVCAAPPAAQPAAQALLERGQEIYEKHCAFCHGVDGEADTPVGRLLTPHPRKFADPVEMARVTVDRMYRATKEGRPGTAMPAWGQVLSETQIGDVIEYVRTLASAQALKLSVEQLSLKVGRRIYEKDCELCHGKDGRADTDAAKALRPRPRNLADPIEMARVDDGRLYSAIKLGRRGTGMAGWGELLSPVEIIDVIRYVRRLAQPLPAGMTRARLDVAVGERIYREDCVPCHGEKGDGQTPLGQSLVPRPRDFNKPRELTATSDKEMAQVIARGIPGTAQAPWSGILNSEDIRRVILFIRQTFHQSK